MKDFIEDIDLCSFPMVAIRGALFLPTLPTLDME